jgi:hypothetical protein
LQRKKSLSDNLFALGPRCCCGISYAVQI